MKQKKILNLIATIMIVAGILLLLKEPFQNYLIKNTIKDNQITSFTKEEIRENNEEPAIFDFDQAVQVDWDDVMEGYRNRTELPVIGGLSIPSIDLRLPVLKGLSNDNLYAGAGTMTANQQIGEGNYSLASHNILQPGMLFSDVQYMEIGDNIYLTDLEKISIYKVSYLERVSPSRVDLVEEVPNKSLITLVTCSNDVLMRWVCQGELVETVALEDATEEMVVALELDK